jgi:hypothetical protein
MSMGYLRLLSLLSVALTLSACGAAEPSQSAQSTSRPTHATQQPSAPPDLISITAPANCAAAASGDITGYFTLTVADNGHDYAMRPCQVVFVQLFHAQPDGCHWTTVESTDQEVLGMLPVPLPAPPVGGTLEVYEALGSGWATLESTLACAGGDVSSRWSVAAAVGSLEAPSG